MIARVSNATRACYPREMKRFIACCLSCSLCFSLFSPIASAQTVCAPDDFDAGFNPELILSDADLFDIGAMTLDRVQRFLEERGVLGRVQLKDIDGQDKRPSDIIWRVATSYKINPKYLLALIQKEQSLVEDTTPTAKQFDWAAGYGVCDSCAMADPAIQAFKGFASQLEWAAKQYREKYLYQILGNGRTISGIAPGKPVTIDGKSIIPRNNATAMLYSYTPHFNGNLNLWRIWRRWFSLTFPDGSIVRGKTSKQTYLIRFGEKRPFKTKAVLASMSDPEKILLVEDSDLSAYPLGAPIAFSNYSIVQVPDGKRYLLVGNQKRLITSLKAFRQFGFNEDELIEAEAADLDGYDDGLDITTSTTYPTGLFAKDATGAYWYVEDGVRHLLPNKTFISLYFKGRTAKLLSQKTLATLPIVSPYQLHTGELVRTKESPAVYVIERGERRPILSGLVFEELGWKWKNVITLPASLLNTYPIGDPVQLQTPLSSLSSVIESQSDSSTSTSL